MNPAFQFLGPTEIPAADSGGVETHDIPNYQLYFFSVNVGWYYPDLCDYHGGCALQPITLPRFPFSVLAICRGINLVHHFRCAAVHQWLIQSLLGSSVTPKVPHLPYHSQLLRFTLCATGRIVFIPVVP